MIQNILCLNEGLGVLDLHGVEAEEGSLQDLVPKLFVDVRAILPVPVPVDRGLSQSLLDSGQECRPLGEVDVVPDFTNLALELRLECLCGEVPSRSSGKHRGVSHC
jgi:hypothetical protein